MSEKNPPFTGVCIMQFERSTLPEHRGSRTVVLRIVKILSLHLSAGAALDDRLPLPEEGCLLQTRFSRGRGAYCVAPWSVDVDQSDRKEISTHLTALKVLFENEEELGKAAKPASSSR
ncbi:hypothetical protein GLOTRDRAFT_109411 [Gloeophyllum trabeum ATCC 11539]|uniref:Uncharacterized protein n=1 Tax=Gloeophyllum trabeum (strain ATCC 11539 / FP-39264 / Madison 617) TaxID=670483 RepID=S7S5R7_GLOTA|nr:uncharacterized protein GLOTRDRAFT_109411 [Gloeophyllum trabeum ATCC 11539]EPQ61359.1 hypothetical protein GLOTRDRAFT_109411 [Gloeophyllum trabeum ATCC 11539]